ncbi:NPCBM/NEW2 domain-containing protein [Deinococcus frigens]|uniref:NPCBM/NEW2 domain-containing protein n=1 Tax=Deinococcus frigens TaxID=249403 RepID=UPI00068AA9A6|nr:NPCBM/NEW2 domain-containing protein [Deinococcus frigens]
MTGKFFPLTLGCTALLLAACSQTPAPTQGSSENLPAGSPYANGQQYPWSDRLDAPGANPYADGRTYDWASPSAASGLNAQALNAGQNYLSDLQWTSATNGWGPVERDRSNGEQDVRDGTTLRVGGRVFAKGLGVHANSEIRYALGGQCNTFSAFVGIDEEVRKLGSAQFKVFGDGRLLFDSGVRRGSDLSLPVDVSVAGVRELRLSVSGGDNNYYDHADWGEAAVYCAAAQPVGNVFLSDLPYVSARNGWGPVEFDKSNGEQSQFDGRPLTIGGQVFARGLGVHSSSTTRSEIKYDLDGKCVTLTAKVGIDDEVGKRGSVVFRVLEDDPQFLDGRELYNSGVVRGGEAARSITVNVKDVRILRLQVSDAGDNMNFDHADWADPQLTCILPAQDRQPGTLDPSFGSGGRANAGGVDVVAEDGGAVAVLDSNFKITRLSPSGAVLAQGAGMPNGVAHALARQADGRLVVVGQISGEMAAARYLPNLTLDPSFGVGGVVWLPLSEAGSPSSPETGSAARDVVVQPDGKIVLGGYAVRSFASPVSQSTALDFALVRLQSSGVPDSGFGQGGKVFTALETLPAFSSSSYQNDDIYGLALQSDGKIVAAGLSENAGSGPAILARYLPTGQLDSSFSGDGIALGGDSGYAVFRTVAVQPDGQIVAGGADARFFTSPFLQKFSSDGTGGPSVKFQFNPAEEPEFSQTIVDTLALQDGGGVIVGGHSVGLNSANTYIARFSSALVQDTSFGLFPGGNVRVGTGSIISLIKSADGKIVATTASRTIDGVQGQGTYRLFR